MRPIPASVLIPIFTFAVVVRSTELVFGGTRTETQTLVPDFSPGLTVFGRSIDIDAGRVVVGANGADIYGSSSGAAYVFDPITGAQLMHLVPDDGAALDWFGWATSLKDTTVLIGAFQDNDLGTNSGSAYLFDVTNGDQLRKLTASDGGPGDRFGMSVATNGKYAVVGAPLWDGASADSGAAYVFDTTTGVELFKLLPDDGAAQDQFGYSVGIAANHIVVGAPFANGQVSDVGAAYVFDLNSGAQLQKLVASDGKIQDRMGWSIAIDGSTVAVGARGAGTRPGAAYLFDGDTGQQLGKAIASDGDVRDAFGHASDLDVTTNTLVVGAYDDQVEGTTSGSIHLFELDSQREFGMLYTSDGQHSDWFGWSVAIDAEIIVGGAINHNLGGYTSGPGQAYVFIIPEPCSAAILWPFVVFAGLLNRRSGQ